MVPSATGDPILLIKIIADKDVASGVYECLIDNQRFSTGKVDDPYAHLGVNTKFYITIDGTTGVKDVNAAKEVAGVKYFNIAGMESSEPFQGMNIVVTSYTDGTQSTAKVMK